MSDSAAPITSRWEFRVFGDSFGVAEEMLTKLTAQDVAESDEFYLLSQDGDNVKVRDDVLDVKVLRAVNARGLERWEPVLKAPFPLDAGAVSRAFEALRAPLPTLSRSAYSLDDLQSDLMHDSTTIRVVPVHKRRVRYTVGGCMSELSEISAGGRQTRTLAVEAEDPQAVSAAVSDLGLGDRLNTSVPRGLLALLDDEPPRFAVIDMGTNSVKFHLAERTPDGSWRRLVDRAETTRLGDSLAESGEISHEALDRTVTAISGMVEESRRHHAQAIAAVGTAGLRSARNREEVVAAIEDATGVTVEPISGEEESRLAYLAVRAELQLPDSAIVVFDTGGGSSQFTFGRGADVDERFSLEVGAVRYTEGFRLDHAVPTETLDAALAAMSSDLDRLDGRPTPDVLVGMGGAITNITAVKLGLDPYDPDAVQGTTLERAEIDRQIDMYCSHEIDERRTIVGLQPKRADVILAGACIVRTVMEKLGRHNLTVSDRGLRHGLLVERFGAATKP